jgi:hypothetical protein
VPPGSRRDDLLAEFEARFEAYRRKNGFTVCPGTRSRTAGTGDGLTQAVRLRAGGGMALPNGAELGSH